jgi:hypothetical protein
MTHASPYREQVAAALGAVRLRGAGRYEWLGSVSPPLDRFLSEAERRPLLVASLREELYRSFYCHGRPIPARRRASEPGADRRLVRALSDANTGRGSWEPGWTVERLGDGEAVVASARLRARVPLAECRAEDGAVRPGARVLLRLPKELPARSPGFFSVVGDAVLDRSATEFVRVYWNVGAGGAAALVGELCGRLNAATVPFRLKVADHRCRLERCDAAVLYVPRDAFGSLHDEVCHVAHALAATLGPGTPAFTLALAPGVGAAEDASASESFGQRRCALLAEGIVRAHEAAAATPDARFDVVAARFGEDRVDVDAPYRDPALAGRHVL